MSDSGIGCVGATGILAGVQNKRRFLDEFLLVDLIRPRMLLVVFHFHVPFQVVLAREDLLTHAARADLGVLEVGVIAVLGVGHQVLRQACK